MQKEYERYIIECIKYSKKLDQPVHSGMADWLPANPERGISPPQSDGQALAGHSLISLTGSSGPAR